MIRRARRATYRLQLSPEFTFAEASETVDALARLGVSHLYLSPVAEAVTGSSHGYDVVDPTRVRQALGGESGLRALCVTAQEAGLSVVIDLVPNHVAAAEPHRNRWWWDLLARGRDSSSADIFDVDWDAAEGKVVLPVLGRPLDEAIEAGEIRVDRVDPEGLVLRYWDRILPLRADGPRPEPGAPPAEIANALAQQHYLLQFWREPRRNVRRFFTIDDLVAIRPEVDRVAEAVLAPVAELIDEGLVDGVRLDHIDGLADPTAYLSRLRTRLGPERWVLIEKILVGDERVGSGWPVDGTTGYEWITLIDHVFTHPDGEAPITDLWRRTTDDHDRYHEHERRGVVDVLDGALRPDLERVLQAAGAVAGSPTERALVALTADLGRYRTYLNGPDAADERSTLSAAVERAARHLDPAGREALADLISGMLDGGPLRNRWQQLSGPALAKGGEDRALYRWMRLAAHNEVGGDPGRWSTSLDDFHRHNAWVAANRPSTLLASSTHDTKRSEDVRARLLALSVIGDEWAKIAGDLIDRHELVSALGGAAALLAVQTAVGAWPIGRERLGDYLVKAGREAEVRTSWVEPDEAHEGELRRVAELLAQDPDGTIASLVAHIDPTARSIALAQLALRLTAPGVPDIYQGSERWLHTLVDPDNRAPLVLDELTDVVSSITPDGDVLDDAHPKASLMARILGVRARHERCFGADSVYEPLMAEHGCGDHVVAFARTSPEGDERIVTVATRFPTSDWGGTSIDLPPGTWTDIVRSAGGDRTVRGGPVEIAELLGPRPVAVLVPTVRAEPGPSGEPLS